MRIILVVVEAGEETDRGALVTTDGTENEIAAIRQGAQALALDAATVTWEYGRGTVHDSAGLLVAKCYLPKPFSNVLDRNPA
jgi:hypothetical protein